MRTAWREGGADKAVVGPVSLIVSAFAPLADVRRTLTPQLRHDCGATVLAARGPRARPGTASAPRRSPRSARSSGRGRPTSTIRHCCSGLAAALRELRAANQVLAYHDRSDGGLFATLVEMAFAGHCGLELELPVARGDAFAQLFSEELGVVLQLRVGELDAVRATLVRHGFGDDGVVAARCARRTRASSASASASARCSSTSPGKTCAAPGPRLPS